MSAWPGLVGRDSERELLDNLLTDVQAGRSRVLVLRGEAGIGKTALLEHLIGRAEGLQVRRTAGVESEMELPFAGLHQLCGSLLDRLHKLPAPQRDSLTTTFGLKAGNPPDRFLVALAMLNLLARVAEEQPLLCVVDDAQWLDQASAQTVEFVARRLAAERVGFAFATRELDDAPTLTGLPELRVLGLRRAHAAALVRSVLPGRLDASVRDRILAESRGNPLALMKLPRELCSTELTFRSSAAPQTAPVRRLEEGFLRQLTALPEQCRQLMVLAAVEPDSDLPLLWRAAERLGIEADALLAAESAGLLELRERVRFRHPLVRTAVYRAASPEELRQAHQALADASDPGDDPDRRAWHRALAAVGPDEAVAADLRSSADRAYRRGGAPAAAACLEAAAALTPDLSRRAQRSLEAARAKATAGAFDDASALLAAAQAGPLDEAECAQLALLQAQIIFHSRHGNEGLPMLLSAGRRLEPIDPELARSTYLDAMAAAVFAGRLTPGADIGMRQVAEAVRDLQLPAAPGKPDLLLRAISMVFTEDYASAAPDLRDTVHALGDDGLTVDEAVRCAWLGACAATDLRDDVNWDVLTRRHLEAVRDVGALSVLPVALNSRAIYALVAGDLVEAQALVAEAAWVADITAGQNTIQPHGEVCLNAIRGNVARAEPQIQQLLDDSRARSEGLGLSLMGWFGGVLYNGMGRFHEALAAAQLGAAEPLELGPPKWALGELVEAAVRCGNTEVAAGALEQLSAFSQASGTELALGITSARAAMLSKGEAAQGRYEEAIERLDHTKIRVEQARARLLYGEWLRRDGRLVESRTQLRTAYEAFTGMGVGGFAERARLELVATGLTVRKRPRGTAATLTAREAHIARLAADGLTNQEIGAQLFLSAKTVEWHLRKVFANLGVTSRRQLRQALPQAVQPAG